MDHRFIGDWGEVDPESGSVGRTEDEGIELTDGVVGRFLGRKLGKMREKEGEWMK